MEKLEVKINLDSILDKFSKVAKEVYETVALSLKAIDRYSDDKGIKIPSDNILNQFDFGKSDLEDRKKHAKYWLLAQGFKQLVQGVSLVLIESMQVLEILEYHNMQGTKEFFEQTINDNKKQFDIKFFGELISKIQSKIDIPLVKEIKSINKARNCLEHANGTVRENDTNDISKQVMKIEWIKGELRIESNNSNKQVLKLGTTVQEGGSISISFLPMYKEYKLNDKISFSTEEFLEILFTCLSFVQNLLVKLKEAIEDKRGV